MGLNRETGGDLLWSTENYAIAIGVEETGYQVINTNTGQVEMYAEQEPQAVMAALWLQDAYDDIMADPEREFRARKLRENNRGAAGQGLVSAGTH